MYLINLYKFSEGSNHSLQKDELILVKQEKSLRLCTIKFDDINVNAHLQIFVVVDKGCHKLYSFNSILISFQNQTENVISIVDIFNTKSALLSLPIIEPATDISPAFPEPPVVTVRVVSTIWIFPPTNLTSSAEVVIVAPEAFVTSILSPPAVV